MDKELLANIEEFEGAKVIPADEKLVLDVTGFEGPIDLLLTLAQEQKVDLTQISILELADQYLAWVAELRQSNLELAADYLVMAAWLAYLKSRLLLPDDSDEEEPTGEDLAAALQFQLRRLESMQDAGAALMSRKRLGQDFFSRGNPEKFGHNINASFEVTLYDLLHAYGDHVRRSRARVLRILPSQLYSPEDALKWFTQMLETIPDWTDLSTFLPTNIKEGVVGRSMVASALVAALQLTKEGRVQMRQTKKFSNIYIRQGKKTKAT